MATLRNFRGKWYARSRWSSDGVKGEKLTPLRTKSKVTARERIAEVNKVEDDIKKSTEVLSKYSNQEIIGYRSPCFSQNVFLDDILIKCGYKYTSMGISSFLHDRYAKNDYLGNKLPDFPLPVAKILNMRIPATGGGWFRLFPIHTQKTLLQLSAEEPKVFYCHPWDFDYFQDDLDFLPYHVRFRHFVNVKNALLKLDYLNFEKHPLNFLIQNDLKQDYIK